MASLKMVWFEFWIVNLKFYMLVLYKKYALSESMKVAEAKTDR